MTSGIVTAAAGAVPGGLGVGLEPAPRRFRRRGTPAARRCTSPGERAHEYGWSIYVIAWSR
jgi:hypothetical protein